MRKALPTTTALILSSATIAQGGGMAEPIMAMEPEIVMEETAGSSGNFIIPLIIIALIAAAASSSSEAADTGLDSDLRVKTDIVPVGMAPNGLPVYQYRYTGSNLVFEGVMAQDVMTHTPEAVIVRPSGTLAVDYSMLGIDLKIVD